jgi:hypothetical protein
MHQLTNALVHCYPTIHKLKTHIKPLLHGEFSHITATGLYVQFSGIKQP